MDKTFIHKKKSNDKKKSNASGGKLVRGIGPNGRNIVIPISIPSNIKNKLEFGKFTI